MKAVSAPVISRDGTTSDGAKLNICVMYRSDISEVRPVDISVPSSISHSEFTDIERLVSSPALYLRKNSAGSDITLIIIED